jgi:AbiV family abortive infection protein
VTSRSSIEASGCHSCRTDGASMTESHDRLWSASIAATLAVGQRIAHSIEEFDRACDHIVSLLKDASALLERGSYSTAAFLAITALEETSKVHLGMYRRSAEPIARRKDPLYQHGTKHRLALGPTVAMGSRLQQAIGEVRVRELIQQASVGGFVGLRESALYVEQREQGLVVPADLISQSGARELLLLSIEAFDDGLVGYTKHTFTLRVETDEIFARWQAT